MEYNLIIPIKVNSKVSLNVLYSNCHWYKRKKLADEIHALIKSCIYGQIENPKILENPIILDFKFNTKLDLSNTAYLVKIIEDGLKDIIIKNDSPKYVKGIILSFWKNEGISLTIKEI